MQTGKTAGCGVKQIIFALMNRGYIFRKLKWVALYHVVQWLVENACQKLTNFYPKIPEIERRAVTGFSTEHWCAVVQHASFVNQFATWLSPEGRHSFDLRVFVTSWLCWFFLRFFVVEKMDVKEQCFRIKFCFKPVECHKAHKYLNRHKPTTGVTCSKMAKCQMTKTNILDDFHLAQRWEML